ncbi:MAG: hypothetical protein E7480_00560 [Ruminococcaceae bacterium]|nr:hypothetical protein [Oscillospiraceae bacterium]
MERQIFKEIKGIKIIDKNIISNLLFSLLGFILTNGYIFSNLSPFGVALTAAFSIKSKLSILPVAVISASYFIKGTEGIKYAVAVWGIYALRKVFKKNNFKYDGNSFFALASGIIIIVTSLGELLQSYATALDIMYSISIGILCGGICFFYIKTIPVFENSIGRNIRLTKNELIGVLICVASFLLSLCEIRLFEISLGHILGSLIILISARCGGIAFAGVSGIAIGSVLSLSQNSSPSTIGVYAFGALVAGIFSERRKIICVISFLLANILVGIYINNSEFILINLTETALGSLIYLIMPKFLLNRIGNSLTYGENLSVQAQEKFKELFVSRLKNAASSFSQLAYTVKASGEIFSNKAVKQTPDQIISNVCSELCNDCKNKMFCWNNSFDDTMRVLNDCITVFKEKGSIDALDLPGYFRSRCLKSEALASKLSLKLYALYSEEDMEHKQEENRAILAQQYSGVSQIMDNIASELEDVVKFNSLYTQRVTSYLCSEGLKCEKVFAYSDADGFNVIEAQGKMQKPMPSSKKICYEISKLIGCDMEMLFMKSDGINYEIKLCEKEELSVFCAKAMCQKNGETVCGDFASSFRAGRGKYAITLSDGMGSGHQAQRDSLLTVAFLEKLLKAGFDKDSAMELVNSALILKSDDESFATVDIAIINLINGVTEFIKAGAAPTFIKRGRSIYELGCSCLPVGILGEVKFEKSRCRLKKGDLLVMVSDGITCAGNKIISKILTDYNGNSPSEISRIILESIKKICGENDDMTVIAAYINKNE